MQTAISLGFTLSVAFAMPVLLYGLDERERVGGDAAPRFASQLVAARQESTAIPPDDDDERAQAAAGPLRYMAPVGGRELEPLIVGMAVPITDRVGRLLAKPDARCRAFVEVGGCRIDVD